jgi:hypothetical protein
LADAITVKMRYDGKVKRLTGQPGQTVEPKDLPVVEIGQIGS